MVRRLMILLLIGFSTALSANTFDDISARFGARPGSQFHSTMMAAKAQSQQTVDQIEYNSLVLQVARINEYFSGIGAYRSSARSGQIISLLQSVGTPVALQLMADLKRNGSIQS